MKEVTCTFQVLILVVFFGCGDSDKQFDLLPASLSGVSFQNQLNPTSELNILNYLYYYNGGGVGAGDFNNDGLSDLYFVGNQVNDGLYLNTGALEFQDITKESGITNKDGWTTGVSIVDINHDGWLDIYICKVGSYRSIKGRNLLYVNQGLAKGSRIPLFKEEAEKYGLAISSFATQAAFFDFDLDHDLDLFLLNHSVHPNRTYGKGSKRIRVDTLAGDKLFENREGVYVDVSKKSGIYQGVIGYGLGVSIGDVTNDGFPDIYVGNDFFENDYLYINQQDGTFKDILTKEANSVGHTTHYSMGNAMADMNNDGWLDILSLDMLPQDLVTFKSSGSEYTYPIYSYYLKNGYHPQYMQNTLHLNLGSAKFSEIGFFSGVSATEWSWSVLAQDFDLDGFKDVYITNGICGATNDMDFINFIAQNHIQQQINEGSKDILNFTANLPRKKLQNYTYKGNGVTYEDMSLKWFDDQPSFSNGSVSADLDNDGDLDLIVNNINEPAFIYRNNAERSGNSYLKLKFKGPEKNPRGVGATVEVFTSSKKQLGENYPVSSYLSSNATEMVFGLGKGEKIERLKVKWPGGRQEERYQVLANKTLILDYQNAKEYDPVPSIETEFSLLSNVDLSIDFEHRENQPLEFDRDPLIPFGKGNEGPKVSVADVNNDGLEDFFIGGAKWQSDVLFVQNDSGFFDPVQQELWEITNKNETTDQVFLDADGDGDLDLIVASGGNEFAQGKPVSLRYYENDKGVFHLKNDAFGNLSLNVSVIDTLDIERDGDMDLLVCSNTVPLSFGETSQNYILVNDGLGVFKDQSEKWSSLFSHVGLVEDIEIADFDGNGFDDVLMTGYWMTNTLLLNDGSRFRSLSIDDSKGWWNTINVADFDRDGDLDFVVGNWGLNTRLKASIKEPIRLYRNDFDGNGKIDPILTYFYNGLEITLASKDELVKQLPHLNKKYLSYSRFAKASLSELLSKEKLTLSDLKEVTELASCYFENKGGNDFVKRQLPASAQFSSVHDILIDDLNNDGFPDLLLVGNQYEISTQLGRLDASHGLILLNDQRGFFDEATKQQFDVSGPARSVEKLRIGGEEHFIVGINDAEPIFLKKLSRENAKSIN